MKKTTQKSIIGIILFLAMSSTHAVDETIPHPIDERGLLSDIAIKTTKLFRPVEIIAIKDGRLEKTELTVESGTVVVIDNQDNANHRLLFPPAAQNIMVMEFVSTVIKQGEKWGAEFLDPGEYPFNCTLHPEQEHGVVTVIEKNE
ncbi:MAG: hypothetical protein HKN08_10565 [Gammaproteobacteria bacterium]|nr:hypothetical protein [Gammaproteobacteria bacterium]